MGSTIKDLRQELFEFNFNKSYNKNDFFSMIT